MKRLLNYTFICFLIVSMMPASTFAQDVTSHEVVPPQTTDAPAPSEPSTNPLAVPSQQVVSVVGEVPPATRSGVMISYVQTIGVTGVAGDEVVELYNNSDSRVDVTGWCVKRISSGEGNTITNVGCIAVTDISERIILPARSSVVFASMTLADFAFASGMSDAGGAVAVYDASGMQIDAVAWGSNVKYAEGGVSTPALSKGKALQRLALESGVLQDTDHTNSDMQLVPTRTTFSYGSLIDIVDMCQNIDDNQATVPDGYNRDLLLGNCTKRVEVNECHGVGISEIAANRTEQFIEVHNSSDAPVTMTGCQLMTNRSTATYVFDGLTLQPDEYRAFSVTDMGLTLTKTTTGAVYLLSSDGVFEIDKVEYKNLAVDTSWSLVDTQWQQTYAVTNGVQNRFERYAACDEGYVRSDETGRCNKVVVEVPVLCRDDQYRSEETGRCRTIAVASTPAPCKEDQYRSEETHRCRLLTLAVASILKPCADDQFRNPVTNRCKVIASSDDVALVDCGEGHERNLDTHRCRNSAAKAIPEAAFAVTPVKERGKAFVGWWALGGVGLLAAGYGAWEWRREVATGIRRVGSFFISRK